MKHILDLTSKLSWQNVKKLKAMLLTFVTYRIKIQKLATHSMYLCFLPKFLVSQRLKNVLWAEDMKKVCIKKIFWKITNPLKYYYLKYAIYYFKNIANLSHLPISKMGFIGVYWLANMKQKTYLV